MKGFDHIIKATKILNKKKLAFKILCKKPLRGKNFNTKNQKNLSIVDEDIKLFMEKIQTFVFPFQAEFGTNVFPSAVIESIFLNKNLILPNFEIFKELIKLCNYEKKTIFFKKNDYKDLAKCIELSLKKKL